MVQYRIKIIMMRRSCHLNRSLLLWKIANEHYYNNVKQLNFNVNAALFLCFSGKQLG